MFEEKKMFPRNTDVLWFVERFTTEELSFWSTATRHEEGTSYDFLFCLIRACLRCSCLSRLIRCCSSNQSGGTRLSKNSLYLVKVLTSKEGHIRERDMEGGDLS